MPATAQTESKRGFKGTDYKGLTEADVVDQSTNFPENNLEPEDVAIKIFAITRGTKRNELRRIRWNISCERRLILLGHRGER